MGRIASTTLIDIARICEVDISTVSRALSDDARVRPETKKRISETAARLGYHPNLAARMLRAKKSRYLWFVAPDLGNPVDCDLVEAAALAAAERDYEVIVSLHLGRQKIFNRTMTAIASGLAGGAIINRRDIEDLSALHGLMLRKFPIMVVDVPIDSLNLPTVTTDHLQATDQLIEACVEAGAKTFAVLFSPEMNLVNRRRYDAAVLSLNKRSIPYFTADQLSENQDLAKQQGPIALVGTHQVAIQTLISQTPALSARKDLIIGCYDQWVGSIYPAKRALVAIQNCTEIARLTVQRIIDLLYSKDPASLQAEIDLPLLRIDTVR